MNQTNEDARSQVYLDRSNESVQLEIVPDIFQDGSGQSDLQHSQQIVFENQFNQNAQQHQESDMLQNRLSRRLNFLSKINQNQSDQIRQSQVYSEIYPNRSNQGAEINPSIISEIVEQPAQPPQNIMRVFKINNKEFTYDGPKNDVVDLLIAVLEQLEIQDKKKQNQQNGRLIELINKISKKILFQFIIFNYQIKFDVSQLILTIIYWSVFIYMLVESINFNNKEIIKNYQQLINYLPFILFLYTLGCQIFSYFNNKIIWSILFIILFIIPSFILLDYYQDYVDADYGSLELFGVVFCLLCVLIFFQIILNKIVKRNFKGNQLQIIYPLIQCFFYILSTVFICFKSINLFSVVQIKPNEYLLKNILREIYIPLFIMQFLLTCILLKDLFRFPVKYIFQDLKQLSTQEQTECVNIWFPEEILTRYAQYLNYMQANLISCNNYLSNFASICFLTLIIYVSCCLYQELIQDGNNLNSIILYLFMFFALPIFLLSGTLILNTNCNDHDQKYFFYIPIISSVLNVLSLNFWSIMQKDQQFEFISIQMWVYQPSCFIIWITIGLFRSHQRIQKLIFIIFQIILFAFSFSVILPLSEIQDSQTLRKVFWLLFYFGVLPKCLLLIELIFLQTHLIFYHVMEKDIIYQFYKSAFNSRRRTLLWVNSISYIGFSYLIYYIICVQNTEMKYQGIAIGFLIINLLFYCLTFSYHNQNQIEQQIGLFRNQQVKLNKILIVSGQILSFLVFLLVLLIGKNDTCRSIALILCFGLPIIFQYNKLLKNVKKSYEEKFKKYVLQHVTIISFQFFKVVWASISFKINITENVEQIQYYAQALIKYSIFCFILVIGNISHYYLNKKEKQNKSWEIQKQLFEYLLEHNVILSKKVLKRIFQTQFQIEFPKEIELVLGEDTEIAFLQYTRTNQEIYLFIFISLIQYEWSEKQQFNENNQSISKQVQCFFMKYLLTFEQKMPFYCKTQKELQGANFKSQDEKQIIKLIYENESQRQNLRNKIKIDNNQNYMQHECLDSCKNIINLFQVDEYKKLNIEIFVKPGTKQIFLNFQSSRNFEKISELIQSYFKDINKKADKPIFESFTFTFSNILALIFRFYDYFSFACVAFDPFFQDSNQSLFRFVDFSFIYDLFQFKFYLACIMTCTYLLLGLIAISQISKKIYGLGDDGKTAATYRNSRFWLSKAITVLNTLNNFVITAFLNNFNCDFTTQPYSLLVEPNVICLSEIHNQYIIISIICLLIYFPLSAYLYPILQYEDKSTNLRFEQKYVVLYLQAKLIIITITLSKTQVSSYVYIFDAIFSLYLAYNCYKQSPCKIQRYNTLEAFIFLQLFIIFIGGFVLRADNKLMGLIYIIMLEVFCCIIYLCKNWSCRNRAQVSSEVS